MTDTERIRNTFRELRNMGWFARMRFLCCQSCGCAAVPTKYNNKYVFYHAQDAKAIQKDGNIGMHGMYMSHGEGGNTIEILDVLHRHGLNIEWDGSMDTRILVKHRE